MAISTSSTPRVFSSFMPELGALALLDPKAKDLLGSVRPDAERNINRLVAHSSFIAHLDPDRIEEDQGIKGLQGAVLPFRHLVQDGVGDRADQVGRDVDPIDRTS